MIRFEHGAKYIVRRIVAGVVVGALAIVVANALYVVLSVIIWAL